MQNQTGNLPVKDGDSDVYNWISDMREHIQSTKSKDDYVDFIMDHLTVSRKSKVTHWPIEERNSDILKTLFEIKEISTQRFQTFYQQNQRQDDQD